MKRHFVLFLLVILFFMPCLPAQQGTITMIRDPFDKPADAEWLIVGAGPAGIAMIGVLHDLGVSYESLMWVDPEFNVGRIGQHYQTVPANNATGPFINFVNACATFNECDAPSLAELRQQDPNMFPQLGIIVPALQDITQYLRTRLTAHQGWLQQLHFHNDLWHARVNDRALSARHVILATGSHPREFDYDVDHVIPLDIALNRAALQHQVVPDDTIGVVGSSHSAVLVLKFLYDLELKKIINFYRSPLTYTVDMGDWTLNAYNGLKGAAAQWAREVLEGDNPPKNIVRVYNDEQNREHYLPECNKIIYAVGYERNETPLTDESNDLAYDPTTGVIAPRLFGVGIAFPEYYCDPLGNEDHRVGLTSFMDYIQRIVPQWLADLEAEEYQRSDKYRQHRKVLEKFAQLFRIDLL